MSRNPRIEKVHNGQDDAPDRSNSSQRGQSIVILTFAFVALLALVGLVTDGGLIYTQQGHLQRAVDAAAVTAANQYREGRNIQQIYDAVVQTLQLQLPGFNNAWVYWCNHTDGAGADSIAPIGGGPAYDPHLAELCYGKGSSMPRKLIRVHAQLQAYTVFMRLLGIEGVMLTAQAQSEAAVLNMVLLLDTSESMAYDSCPPDLSEPEFFDCLEACRAAGNCRPFDSTDAPATPSVRWAAYQFVNALMRNNVDRVAVYHLDKVPVDYPSVETLQCAWPLTATVTVTLTPASGRIISLTMNKQAVLDAISRGQGLYNDPLNVYIRPAAYDARTHVSCDIPTHVGGSYGQDAGYPEAQGYGYRWASTNIGGGLSESIDELIENGSTDAAVWVIVLLSDGAANASDLAADVNGWWSCPSPSDSGGPNYRNYLAVPKVPFCRDPESDGVVTRHCPSQLVCDRKDPWYTNTDTDGDDVPDYDMWRYDADDYARDIADKASSYKITIYSIGFGPYVHTEGRGRPDAGERLLRYIADVGDDGDLRTDPCGSASYWKGSTVPDMGEDCGNYYYAENAQDLENVFEDIVSRIFSRLTE